MSVQNEQTSKEIEEKTKEVFKFDVYIIINHDLFII